MTKIPKQPLRKIAIAFSGGGYRATSFHLGTLSYLHRLQFQGKPLIENIKMVSTVSGGTITGVVYALMRQQGKSFDEIYDFLLSNLETHDLIKEGLDKVDQHNNWNEPTKRKNMINAFSELYNALFTKGATFGTFFDMQNSHLDEVAFNAVEFNEGVNFRFQNEGRVGNNYIRVSKDVAREIKLGDIIAASSCFPGGFEPIAFPGDFIHKDAEALKTFKQETGKSAGLMDGGIYDNQGIESIMLAESRNCRRNKVRNYYDLIIVSDVASPYMDDFKFYPVQKQEGYRLMNYREMKQNALGNVGKIKKILWGVLALGLVLLGIGFFIANQFLAGAGTAVALVGVVLFFVFNKIKNKLENLISGAKGYVEEQVPEFYLSKIKTWDISNYPLGKIEPLIMDRLFSMSTLVNSVFLKQIRRLQYDTLYANEHFKFRRISNLIKELTEMDYTGKANRYSKLENCPEEIKGDYNKVFGKNLKELAATASNFGTTLWFTDEDEFNDVLYKLVAYGQATICYNMMGYLTELIHTPNNGFEDLPKAEQKDLIGLLDDCLADWKKFKDNPMFMTKTKQHA